MSGLKKPNMPEWLDLLMQELTKPPYFFNQPKQDSDNQTQSGNKQQANGKERSDSHGDNDEKKTDREKPPAKKPKAESFTRANAVVLSAQPTGSQGSSAVNITTLRNHVSNLYGWKIDQFQQLENVIRLHTAVGSFALKETQLLPQNIDFLYQALAHAKNNGFARFSRFALTKAKKPYIRKGGKTYYATSWVEGSTVNFASIEHIGQIAYTLAQFHEYTRGFEPTGTFHPQLVFNLAQITEERNRDLRQMIHLAEAKDRPDEFDQIFIELKPDLQDDAAQSLSLLHSTPCQDFLTADEKTPGICHLDVIPPNFIYRTNHQVYMLDFDLATFAPRAMDISHLLRRSMQQVNWVPDVAYTCFLNYSAIRTMPKAEYQIVNALLRFPYLAWRVAHTRYRFFMDETQVEELKRYKEQEARRQQFLDEFTKQIVGLGASS
jgi:CotS family spore coat protein